jgi:hypothetical protein
VTTLRTAILVHTGSNHLVVCLLNNRLFKKSTFWCGNGRSHCATLLGRQSQHRLDDPYDDRATQRLFEELLIDRKSLIFNKILTIIHKSLFGEAAAKSDLARNGFVHTVGKTSTELAVCVHTGLRRLGARVSITEVAVELEVCICHETKAKASMHPLSAATMR